MKDEQLCRSTQSSRGKRQAILIEQERRASLAQIPKSIADLAAKFAEGGGSREELLKALDPKN